MPDAELDALRERAKRCRPIPVPFDDDEQCLPIALAACLRLPLDRVPPRCAHEELDEWDRKVKERLGVRLELIDRDEPPPREAWIAIIPGHGEATHAIACLGDDHRARTRLAGYRICPA
jgi:hypothetical protein